MLLRFSSASICSARFVSKHVKVTQRVRRLASAPSDLSYVHGASTVALAPNTINDVFRSAVDRTPDRNFVIFHQDNITKTYQQVFQDARQFAGALLKLGLRPGDRVAVWGPNYYQWVVTQLAVQMSGLILVTLNPAYQASETAYALRKVGVSAVVTPPFFKTTRYYDILVKLIPELAKLPEGVSGVSSSAFPDFKHVIVFRGQQAYPGAWNFADLISDVDNIFLADMDNRGKGVSIDDVANVKFTSGTTGQPKAAALTHHAIVNNAYCMGLRLGFGSKKPTILGLMTPLFHVYAYIGLMTVLLHGQTALMPSGIFNAELALEAIHKHRATFMYGTPTMYVDMLASPILPNVDLSSIQGAMSSGAPMSEALFNAVFRKLHIPVLLSGYGATELTSALLMCYQNDSVDVRRLTVGYIMDNVEAGVVDLNTRRLVPRCVKGELVARGYTVMKGYWDDDKKTREAITPDGWYHTGDLVTMNSDGSITMCGRTKELILRGGENVYPAEVEQLLHHHPAIADVYVVGVPDARLGEEICACVSLRENHTLTVEEVKKFCTGKIAHNKIPKYLLIKKNTEMPATASGKIQRVKLKEICMKELNFDNIVL